METLRRLNDLARGAPATARAVLRQLDRSYREKGAGGTARGLVRYVVDTYREQGVVGTARTVVQALGTVGDDASSVAPADEPPVPAAAPAEPPAPPKKRTNWELRTQAELVDYITDHHHAGVRDALPRLETAARKVEREHAAHPAVPRGLADRLAELAGELEAHMLREETMLFPTLRTGARGGGELDMPMRMMERDHDAHADELACIRELTGDLRAPADASDAWRKLYADLAAFAAELQEHVYLENNILFARATGNSW